MKKVLTRLFILLIGFMILGGCTSTTNEPSGNQQQNQQNANAQPQQNQQQAGIDKIPQPPALPEG